MRKDSIKHINSFINNNESIFIIKFYMIKTVVFKLASSQLTTIRYSYVRKKDIDQICTGYTDSKMDKIKMYTRMFAHIGK